MRVNSGSARLTPIGDLGEILAGDDPSQQMHGVYHEAVGGDFWAVFYNNSYPFACFDIFLPVMGKRTTTGGE
jgi:hypothetical protein